jgi:radical SAM superfamily enzyme YgiQ (UPF0313 family)
LAAAIEKRGYRATVVQQGFMGPEEILHFVETVKPFCVGLSVLTHTASRSQRLAEAIKARYPSVFIVVGGQHPSLATEYVCNPAFDFAVLGEGEITFTELLDFISGRRFACADEVRGIAYYSRSLGKLVQTPPRPRVSDLDSLPPAKRSPAYLRQARSWNLSYPSPLHQIAVAQITYSRGCRYRCAFCVSPTVWDGNHQMSNNSKSVTYRSAKSVALEVQRLHQVYGVNFLYFTDLTFNDDPRRIEELCGAFINAGLHGGSESDPHHLRDSVHWFALVKVGLDDATARSMVAAGCSKIGMGVESFSTAQVHAYKKPYKGLEILHNSLTAADKVGIINRCLLVLGAPTETPDTVEDTIVGLQRFPIDQVRIGFLTPYPNTSIHTQYRDRLLTVDFDLYDEERPVIKCPAFSSNELLECRQRIGHTFYSSSAYGARCSEKLKRFPWLQDSYAWFFNDLHSRTGGAIDLRSITSRAQVNHEVLT